MLKNYLTIAFRTFRRQRLHSIINITGLSVGMACSFLIMLHVKDELSYEKCYTNADRMYRITIDSQYGDGRMHWAVGPPLLAPAMQTFIPEIEEYARFRYIGETVLSYWPEGGKVKRFSEEGGYFTDASAIDMFDLQFIYGDPVSALTNLGSIVLTATMAEKYFGDENPVGKTMMFDGFGVPATVTGVIKDRPSNTHLQFDYLVPFELFITYTSERAINSRTWKAVYNYVLVNEQSSVEDVSSKLFNFMINYYQGTGTEEEILAKRTIHFQPIGDIHLHSNLEQKMGPNSDITYVYVFSFVAVLILVIAGINFVNIATAQAFKRMKEVGLRKVLGAQRKQLIGQFIGEVIFLTVTAALLSMLLLYIVMPYYNAISGKELYFGQIFESENIMLLLAIIVALGVLAGIYPAFFISQFKPVFALRGLKNPGFTTSIMKKGLISFQFVISIFLIFSTITIYKQLIFFETSDLGFNKEKILAVELYGDVQRSGRENVDALKAELLQNSAIASVSLASNLPGRRFSVEFLRPVNAAEDEQLPSMRFIRVDEHYLETLDIVLKEGRNFQRKASFSLEFLINETAARALHLENPVGEEAISTLYGETGTIVGVIGDYHYASLHDLIEPLVLEYRPGWRQYLLVKMRGEDRADIVDYVREKVAEIAPDQLFIYSFLDDELRQLYRSEDRVREIFQAFSLLAIFISCLGLFGLSAYSAELKIKEIGVRKVLGARISGIVFLLSRTFLVWIIFAGIIGCGAAYLTMDKWLQNFAYRSTIDAWIFVISIVSAAIIAFVTLSYQSLKAALTNPVDSLRNE